MSLRPDLVANWVRGWSISRNLEAPTPAFGGWRVHVGLPDQIARYVFAAAGEGVRQASTAVAEPHVFIKVCDAPAKVETLLAEGWRLHSTSAFMAVDRLPASPTLALPGYRLENEMLEAGFAVDILDGDVLAASGRVLIVNDLAVFDRIETKPEHRRRGLGRLVMSTLTAGARHAGALSGALVATDDGRALYESLGWRTLSPYATAVRA